jgi:hypothetical protein
MSGVEYSAVKNLWVSWCVCEITAVQSSTGADDETAEYGEEREVLGDMIWQLTTGKREELLVMVMRQLTARKREKYWGT